MRRILCVLSALSFAVIISGYVINSNVRAEEINAAEKTTAKDIVCGMDVNKDKALKADHDGKTYYFCSKHCEETFKKDPSKYLKK
ncbi:MAG: YHS domain-containing protein [Planctomycetes bacterium]|nr:YHS domain-containing protein [Planctomycetota bacterium]